MQPIILAITNKNLNLKLYISFTILTEFDKFERRAENTKDSKVYSHSLIETYRNERKWQNFDLKIIEEQESGDKEEDDGDDEHDHHPAVEEPHKPLLLKIWKHCR